MVIDGYKEFLDLFFNKLHKVGIDFSNMQIDHIAYTCKTNKEYESHIKDFETLGVLVHYNPDVRGAKVRIYKLNQPLEYKNQHIDYIELISPKIDGEGKTGFEHAEIVVENPKDFMEKYPNLEWDIKDMNSDLFPMIKLNLRDGIRAKFPRKSVSEVGNLVKDQ